MSNVALIIPMLNEADALPRLVRVLAALSPQPAEIIAVDGGSTDESLALAANAGWRIVTAPRGRGVQIDRKSVV